MKVFTSGSCRIVSVINNGYNLVNVIHSWIGHYTSINYLSFYHSTKQHIQFINYIRKNIEIPDNILNNFMIGGNEELDKMRKERTENIRKEFELCDVYIFEICSLKYFTHNMFQINKKINEEYIQDKDDLYNDLDIIRSMIPIEKKIIFQSHIRLNVVYSNETNRIEKREIINDVITRYCNNNKEKNVQHFDPSYLVQLNPHIIEADNKHFHDTQYKLVFDYIYKNYITN
jgi:hypothetical protein